MSNTSTKNTNEQEFAKKVLAGIDDSPCNFLATQTQAKILEENGYTRLDEALSWDIVPGEKYYVTRNNSSLIAFQLPQVPAPKSIMLMTSHCDYPALKIKNNPEIDVEGKYTTINVEVYGGGIYYTWFDVPLSVSGRVIVKCAAADGKQKLETRFVNVDRDLFIIPSQAKHQNRTVNDGFKVNPQVDLLPLFGDGDAGTLNEIVAETLEINPEDIVQAELYTYRRQKGFLWGAHNEYAASVAVDDQTCLYCSLFGFLDAQLKDNIAIHAAFDNEEIGSTTRQGAAGTFLSDVIDRIGLGYNWSHEDKMKIMAGSFGVMADNAHALHPNHTEVTDPKTRPYMGDGLVVKYSAGFSYSTDAQSGSIVNTVADKAGVKIQEFFNRADVRSGGTLGKYLVPTLSPISADIGLAQLSMHSSLETCSVKDLYDLKVFAQTLFSTSLSEEGDGTYIIN